MNAFVYTVHLVVLAAVLGHYSFAFFFLAICFEIETRGFQIVNEIHTALQPSYVTESFHCVLLLNMN